MSKINCYTWNLMLPPQGVIESKCGYYAIRNGIIMLNLLNSENINYSSSGIYGSTYNNYIKSIKECNTYKKMISFKQMEFDIKKYESVIKSNSLSKSQLKLIINKNNFNMNIFIVYVDNKNMFDKKDLLKLNNILNKPNYRICIIIFKEKLNIIKHWVPIVIDNNNNNIHLHILDSYDMVWWGDPTLKKLINFLYPYNKKITCEKENIKGDLYYFFIKTAEISIIIFVIYLFMYGMFEKKLKRNNI